MTDHLLETFQNLDLALYEDPPYHPMSNSLLAAVVVAEMLQMPVSHAAIMKRVGRLARVQFRPVNYPDPEMILALPGPGAVHFNRVAVDFWQVRERGPRNPAKWYALARATMLRFLPALQRMGATADESDFVLEWAADIVAHMKRQ